MPNFLNGPTAKINSVRVLISILLVHTIGAQMVIIVPGFVQGLVEYLGISDQQAGYIASSEMWGTACGSIAMMYLASRLNWRILVFASLVLLIVSNGLSMLLQTFDALLVIRFFSGVAAGTIISLTYAMLGLTVKSDRNFGFVIMSVLLYATIIFAVLPAMFRWSGIDGLIGFLILYTLIGLPLLGKLPPSGKVSAAAGVKDVSSRSAHKFLGLAAIFLYFISTFGIWTYLYRIGVSFEISEAQVGTALSFSGVAGGLGALCVVLMGSRFGRLLPVLVLMIGSILALLMLLRFSTAASFFIYAIVFNFTWNMTHPFLLATLAALSKDGSMLVYGAAFQMLGTGLGPMAAAYVAWEGHYTGVVWLSLITLTACFACLIRPLLATGRKRSILLAASEAT